MTKWRDWRAVHLFIGSAANADRLLVDSIAPLIREAGLRSGQWFFIRYWELGPHIRLRLRGCDMPTFDALRTRIALELPTYLHDSDLELPTWPTAESKDISTGRILPGQTIEFSYVPEFDRYGGQAALGISERLFGISSQLALETIERSGADLEVRARAAIDFSLAVLSLLPTDHDRAILLDDYAMSWRKFFAETPRSPMTAGTPLQLPSATIRKRVEMFRMRFTNEQNPSIPPLVWAQSLRFACAKLRRLDAHRGLTAPSSVPVVEGLPEREAAIRSILVSQMHMMANRLGFYPHHELRWTEALLRCFRPKGVPD